MLGCIKHSSLKLKAMWDYSWLIAIIQFNLVQRLLSSINWGKKLRPYFISLAPNTDTDVVRHLIPIQCCKNITLCCEKINHSRKKFLVFFLLSVFFDTVHFYNKLQQVWWRQWVWQIGCGRNSAQMFCWQWCGTSKRCVRLGSCSCWVSRSVGLYTLTTRWQVGN